MFDVVGYLGVEDRKMSGGLSGALLDQQDRRNTAGDMVYIYISVYLLEERRTFG